VRDLHVGDLVEDEGDIAAVCKILFLLCFLFLLLGGGEGGVGCSSSICEKTGAEGRGEGD
jgi:hypothetical protein